MAEQRYAYLGVEQRTYASYLASTPAGLVTLVATPGMDPAVVVRAGGNDGLPEVPADGLWAPVDPAKPPRKQPAPADSST